jgi:hypothetical protein
MLSTRRVTYKSTIWSLCAASIALFSVMKAQATPPNTTAANSVPYEVGQGWATHYFDESNQTRWFRFAEGFNRSYCIEAVQGSVSPVQLDPNLAVYTDASGATPLVVSGVTLANNDAVGAPFFVKGARICYISPLTTNTTSVRAIKLNIPIAAASGDAGNIRVRIVETTLISDPGYPLSVDGCVVTLSNLNSIPVRVGASGSDLPPGAATTLPCGAGTAVTITQNAPAGSIVGSITWYRNIVGLDSDGYQSVIGYTVVAVIPLRQR